MIEFLKIPNRHHWEELEIKLNQRKGDITEFIVVGLVKRLWIGRHLEDTRFNQFIL